jgi:hypothetical protein
VFYRLKIQGKVHVEQTTIFQSRDYETLIRFYVTINHTNSDTIIGTKRINFTDFHQGPDSQNFLSQIRKLFVTLGLSIFRFLKLKVFLTQISLEIDVTYNKNNKMPSFMCNIFSNPFKVMKIF